MKVAEAEIDKRLPVWGALSEFFLDTELQADDFERIARKLASSDYSTDELENILICEVCPACRWNLLSPAGEWAGFDDAWLKQKIAPHCGKQIPFKFLFVFRHGWMYRRKWNQVKKRLTEIRFQNWEVLKAI